MIFYPKVCLNYKLAKKNKIKQRNLGHSKYKGNNINTFFLDKRLIHNKNNNFVRIMLKVQF